MTTDTKLAPTDAEIDAVLCSNWPAFWLQSTLVRRWLRDAVREAIAKWGPPAHSGEPVYAFRRKGLDDFCTCTEKRYAELSAKPNLFETRIFYTAPQPVACEPLTDEQAKALLKNSDLLDMFVHIGWYSAPRKNFDAHALTLIRSVEAAHGIKGGQQTADPSLEDFL